MFWAPWRFCRAQRDASPCLRKAGRAEAHVVRWAAREAPKAISAQAIRPLIAAPRQMSRLQKNILRMRPGGDKLHKNLQRCETFDPERLANHISSLSNCTLTKRQRLYKSCHENAQILLITQRELQAHRDVRYMHRLAPRLRLI